MKTYPQNQELHTIQTVSTAHGSNNTQTHHFPSKFDLRARWRKEEEPLTTPRNLPRGAFLRKDPGRPCTAHTQEVLFKKDMAKPFDGAAGETDGRK